MTMRKEHTPGKSKARDQARADTRSQVLKAIQAIDRDTVDVRDLAISLEVPPQRVVSALTQLIRQGEVYRVEQGIYRETQYKDL